jgi:hypothetical protein
MDGRAFCGGAGDGGGVGVVGDDPLQAVTRVATMIAKVVGT